MAALSILVVTSTQARAGIWVDVHLRFNGGRPPAALVDSLQSEASAIWKMYGVDLHWPSSPAGRPNGSTLFDVLLDQHHHEEMRAVLGDARLQAQARDYVAIRLDRQAVEDTIGSVTFDQLAHFGHASLGLSDVGRALGRVLAHELGHALLATRGHQSSGLMRSSFTGDELLARSQTLYSLSTAEIARLSVLQAAQHERTDADVGQSLTCAEDSTNARRPSRSRTVRSGVTLSCSGG